MKTEGSVARLRLPHGAEVGRLARSFRRENPPNERATPLGEKSSALHVFGGMLGGPRHACRASADGSKSVARFKFRGFHDDDPQNFPPPSVPRHLRPAVGSRDWSRFW